MLAAMLRLSVVIMLVAASCLQAQTPAATIESNKIIALFNKDRPAIRRAIVAGKFRRTTRKLVPPDEAAGETLVMYKSGENSAQYCAGMLLDLKIEDVALFTGDVQFLFLKKSALIPVGKRSGNRFLIESTGGMEEIRLKFSGEKITNLTYVAHPD